MKTTTEQKLKMKFYNKLHQGIIRNRAKQWKKNNKKRAKINDKRWRKNHPTYWKEHYTGRTIRFKDKRIWLTENPRKGVCIDCGKTGGKTVLHHTKYDIKNPLAYTHELCIGCHSRQHRLMKYKGKSPHRLYITK